MPFFSPPTSLPLAFDVSATARECFFGFAAASGLNPTTYRDSVVSRTTGRIPARLPIEVMRDERLSSGQLSRFGDPRQKTFVPGRAHFAGFARKWVRL